ncbi:hypothetical protein C0989_005372 [Termitomyces sp. Mn162]|nr:hypothetical protein C0989_005372 [Termitomyces sp. Mn162]
MPPIYDIEQPKAVFDCVLQTKVTVSFCNTITAKCNLVTNVTATNNLEPLEHDASIEEILPTFAYNDAIFSLSSNVATFQGLLENLAPVTSINPVEAYIKLVLPGQDPVVLTCTKKAQFIWSIIMLINNCEEIKCIVNSGSQIIFMLAGFASKLLLTYDLSVVLNIQGTNSTID